MFVQPKYRHAAVQSASASDCGSRSSFAAAGSRCIDEFAELRYSINGFSFGGFIQLAPLREPRNEPPNRRLRKEYLRQVYARSAYGIGTYSRRCKEKLEFGPKHLCKLLM